MVTYYLNRSGAVGYATGHVTYPAPPLAKTQDKAARLGLQRLWVAGKKKPALGANQGRVA